MTSKAGRDAEIKPVFSCAGKTQSEKYNPLFKKKQKNIYNSVNVEHAVNHMSEKFKVRT